jgi:hypothetical protein
MREGKDRLFMSMRENARRTAHAQTCSKILLQEIRGILQTNAMLRVCACADIKF